MYVFERALGELRISVREKDDEMTLRMIVEAVACVAALLGNGGVSLTALNPGPGTKSLSSTQNLITTSCAPETSSES